MKIPNQKPSSQSENQPQSAQGSGNTENFEEKVMSTLDTVCRCTEQTYDEFMAGFTHLKPEHVKSLSADLNDFGPPAEFLEFQRTLVSKTLHENVSNPMTVPVTSTQFAARDHDEKLADDSDVLEEQVLDEGVKSQDFLMRSETVRQNVKVRIGNFLQDAGSYHSDSEDTEVYCPSFGTQTKSSSQSSDTESQGRKNSACDKLGENRSINCENIDHSEQSCLIAVTSNEKQIERSPKRSALETPEVKVETDQSESLLDLIGSCGDDSDNSDLEYDSAFDTLNVGEIKEDTCEENEREPTLTHLEFKVIEKSPDQVQRLSEVTDDTSAESLVEPFSLDDNFDYDHVTLTPKFNAKEMSIIRSMAKIGPIHPVPVDCEEPED